MSLYKHSIKTLDGKETTLDEFQDKTVLIVNVASKCGFTPQYEGLQKLHEKYANKNFAVLGFPCNQFGAQEPGTESEIADFCATKFSVSFPMFEKVDVNGDNTHPIFEEIKEKAPGLLGSKGIKWNFTKFLVGKNGSPIKRFAPKTTPEQLESEIEELLNG